MNSEYDVNNKVYQVGDTKYSINDLLHSAVDEEYMIDGIPRISDFHLKVGEPVRFRLDSDLQTIPQGEILTQEVSEQLIFAMLGEMKLNELRAGALEVDAGFEMASENDQRYNFRLNVFHDRDGIAAVIRFLPPTIPDIEDIGFPFTEVWEDIVSLRQGLVLVTGVTGSGKSTTIASLLDYINKSRKCRVITLEDPVEYIFNSEQALISQREIGEHVESFPRGLFSALRENPDVIYVGEIRDIESATLALSAAETGHLVLSTLHTRDTTGAITRLVDMFPPERNKELTTQLSFSLAYVVSQKLVPSATGSGRVVAMEILKNLSTLGNSLRTGKWHQIYSTIETRMADGMITMEQCLLNLYKEGRITREDAISYSNVPTNIIDHLPAE